VLRGKEGNPVNVFSSHVMLVNSQGEREMHCVDIDLTARRHAEEENRRHIGQLERSMISTLEAVSVMVELRDPYTSGHERRVGDLAAAIGQALGLDENIVKGLRLIGLAHDVGKISVPAEILSKPGRLASFEYQLIQGHSQAGYDVLKGVDFPWPVAEVILQHHERLDGSGYPRGLKGDEILIEARIIAVSDVVEAMSSHRPYRPGLGIEASLGEIEANAGRLYDPAVVAACLKLFRADGYSLPP
jgi:HD-GYP domain-containing protein (c-di-GMP phosphodiesterase class II)